MRRWERLTCLKLCGACGAQIDKGSPAQLIFMAGLQRRLIRCSECADGLVPEVAPLVERVSESVEWTPTAVLASDWKQRQAGEN